MCVDDERRKMLLLMWPSTCNFVFLLCAFNASVCVSVREEAFSITKAIIALRTLEMNRSSSSSLRAVAMMMIVVVSIDCICVCF